jgi:two-component system, chemotaxis family, chemotaxis protein CheY
MNILIADDEHPNRILMDKLLSTYGECTLTENGAQAVEAFEWALEDKEPYDLICLDIVMPEMSGQEALEKIREIEQANGLEGDKETKIIMCTSMDSDDHITDAFFKGGCTDYLTKPITPDSLKAKLKEHDIID